MEAEERATLLADRLPILELHVPLVARDLARFLYVFIPTSIQENGSHTSSCFPMVLFFHFVYLIVAFLCPL
jgi:hypothetical protein